MVLGQVRQLLRGHDREGNVAEEEELTGDMEFNWKPVMILKR